MRRQPIAIEILIPIALSVVMGVGVAASADRSSVWARVDKEASRDGLRLVVSVVSRRVDLGVRVWLLATLVNEKHEFVAVREPQRYAAFELTVSRITKDGLTPVNKTALGRRLLNPDPRGLMDRLTRYRLLRGYGIRYEFDLLKLLDISDLGHYAVTVCSPKVVFPEGLNGPRVSDLRFRVETFGCGERYVHADGRPVEDHSQYRDLYRRKEEDIYRKRKTPK